MKYESKLLFYIKLNNISRIITIKTQIWGGIYSEL